KPGAVNLMGVGAAARAYFDKPAAELDLAEAALLAGIIRAPAELSPYRRPEAALARRNQILDRLVALRWVASERAEAAKAAPLGVRATGYGQNRAPFFAAAVAAEARRRYGIESLADAGLILLSTLDEVEQAAAAAAVEAGVADLAGRVGERGAPLQAALVALDPLTGGARAWVGGRDFRASQFDRVSQMRRQAGSTFKPVVYAAAFAGEVATPATLIADEPLLLELAGRQWSPKNDDGEFLGWISARTAVERSRNLPTVRLALEVGLPPIVDLARRLGVASPLSPVPALALGAFELSPLELATVYSVFASGGVRPPVHTLDGVLDGRGQPLAGTALPPPERVLSPEAAYLVTSLLEGVVAHGTGQRARQLGLTDPVAGKTGTTNQKRDAWFAGFAPGKVALAWV
ncbi:MAG TPA: penicillin-binding transpeptidase domain-containing protein, partial [Thermoanaerobaculia bacterium]|nr:penicillin-binding transpeptidase domain-containing protein [Thermoanaerobaculia bacterium]